MDLSLDFPGEPELSTNIAAVLPSTSANPTLAPPETAFGSFEMEENGEQDDFKSLRARPGEGLRRTSDKAHYSMILGVLSLFCFGALTGIPAVILGILALLDIAQSNGRLEGKGSAYAGIVMGSIHVILVMIATAFVLLGS